MTPPFDIAAEPRAWMLTAAIFVIWLAGWLTCLGLHLRRRTSAALHRELMLRLKTWLLIIVAAVLMVAFGTAGLAVAIPLLGAVCFHEFGKVAGLGRDPAIQVPALLGLVGIGIAIARRDHLLLLQSAPIVSLAMAGAALIGDRPQGYLRRVAIGCLGFTLCGLWLGHLGFLAVDGLPASAVLWTLLCVELNDVFAFTAGKCLGRRPLCPRTSPNKTRGGLGGAIVLTTTFAALSGCLLFAGQPLGNPAVLIPIGFLIATAGAIGDLILSAIKRDLHVKDTSGVLPGHGGLLDRFDSLLFAAPVVSLALGAIANPTLLP